MPQLLSVLHTIFDMGIVLGFMILIHEFGHYAAAKYFGVRVEVFSSALANVWWASRAAVPTIASAPFRWADT